MLKTKADILFEIVEKNLEIPVGKLAKQLGITSANVIKIVHYLEEEGLMSISHTVKGLIVRFEKRLYTEVEYMEIEDIVNRLKAYKESNNIKMAYNLMFRLYNTCQSRKDNKELQERYNKAYYSYLELFKKVKGAEKIPIKVLDTYEVPISEKVSIDVNIVKHELDLTPLYFISLLDISDVSKIILKKIREETINKLSFSTLISEQKEKTLKKEYQKMVYDAMKQVFVDLTEKDLQLFVEYTTLVSLGLGELEFLLKDKELEEIVVNNSKTPVWIYHVKYGWLKTNMIIEDENKIRHYATLAARQINKNITILEPLLDGHLSTGERLNATLSPITPAGNTITIRKFSETPWTISTLLKTNTLNYEVGAWIWLAVQYELSALIVGGTGSGKTTTLNAISTFFPPNQRVVSIEDTRELKIASTLHWVPMLTRLPNPEGKGGITMLDLVVNSLRMRPDRIVVGEIRRKAEAEVLFEAMHTGHSVYGTLHANSVNETITRLTTPPIGIPKTLLPAVSLIIVQHRNRRTGLRRTFQLAEVKPDGNAEVVYEYDMAKDEIEKVSEFKTLYSNLRLLTGLTKEGIRDDLNEKIDILDYFIKNNIDDIESLSSIISDYYTNKEYLLKKLDIR